MPETPGHQWQPLYGANEEIEKIVDIGGGKLEIVQLVHPSASQVLGSLPSSYAVHISCHGVSDASNPSGSHLLLQGLDGQLDKLSVRRISHANIKHAQITYLSACSTAGNASEIIPDESIHIASAFQLASFTHVLATQWVAYDDACKQVFGDFYRPLFSDESQTNTRSDGRGHRAAGTAFHI